MEHPNGKVARASHSLFVSFISLGKESEMNGRVSLKEQLVFYYVQRSLLVSESTEKLDLKFETDKIENSTNLLWNMNIGISWHNSF